MQTARQIPLDAQNTRFNASAFSIRYACDTARSHKALPRFVGVADVKSVVEGGFQVNRRTTRARYPLDALHNALHAPGGLLRISMRPIPEVSIIAAKGVISGTVRQCRRLNDPMLRPTGRWRFLQLQQAQVGNRHVARGAVAAAQQRDQGRTIRAEDLRANRQQTAHKMREGYETYEVKKPLRHTHGMIR